MIFRLTQKAARRLRIECDQIAPGRPSMVEWYSNVVMVERRPFLLFTQAATLFSFWSPSRGWNLDVFGPMFRRHATDALRDYGFGDTDIGKMIDEGPDVFATSADRGVVGSMVDYAKMLRYSVDSQGGVERMGPREMNDIANECPMSKIGMESPARYLRQVLRSDGAA